MTILFLDIETIPTQNQILIKSFKDGIKAPGNYSKQETIDKWLEDNRDSEADKLHRKTAIDGLHGEIFSIAWAFDDGAAYVVYRGNNETEKFLLQSFFTQISDIKDSYGNRAVISKWVGHYITGFDLRFIWQRCVINGVKPSVSIPYDAKPWDDRVFDTKVAWTGSGQYSGAGSLDAMSRAFGLDGKGDIDGSKVYDYWLAGRFDEIAEYNKDDVVKTRGMYKRMNFISAT